MLAYYTPKIGSMLPAFLSQYLPSTSPSTPTSNEVSYATVSGAAHYTKGSETAHYTKGVEERSEFKGIGRGHRGRGALYIHEKRWYFRLVQGRPGEKRARALMDDYQINDLLNHLVICYTPSLWPNSDRPFITPDGKHMRIYAYFDSYLEFIEYMDKFEKSDRAFYEIIFGEFPQKPHFDIDISMKDFASQYPGEDIHPTGEYIRECVLSACVTVLTELGIKINLESDILLYSSHGSDKISYHLILNNWCHDGNKEAEAFYKAVIKKISILTRGKYLKFIDDGVYSPRQQFRIVGCQKQNSNRPKIFYETFSYCGAQYTHKYTEAVPSMEAKRLVIVYESLASFVSGCSFIPSLVPEKPVNSFGLTEQSDLDVPSVNMCLNMLKQQMDAYISKFQQERGLRKLPTCPFSIKEIQGHLILLKRAAPSYCPICQKSTPHENEHPYMFIINGRVWWDCRRSSDTAKKFFVGYLAFTPDNIQLTSRESEIPIEDDEDDGTVMFGDYMLSGPIIDLGSDPNAPKLNALQLNVTKLNVIQPSVVDMTPLDIPMEMRTPNIQKKLENIAVGIAQKKYEEYDPSNLSRVVSFSSIKDTPKNGEDRKHDKDLMKIVSFSTVDYPNWNAGLYK